MPQFSLFWFVAGAITAYFIIPRVLPLAAGIIPSGS